jgi:hypothetical protein
MAVELGTTSLEHLTRVEVSERQRFVSHTVPGLKGDLAQALGRPSVAVRLEGMFYGPTAAQDLGALRTAYLAGEPVDFFAEAVGEGYFAQVLITQIQVSQRAGYLDQFDYACEVLEYVEPPAPAPADLLASLDTDLLGEAGAFMDDVQNALAEVSSITDLIANVPSFADPTTRLPGMLDLFTTASSGGTGVLTTVRDLF